MKGLYLPLPFIQLRLYLFFPNSRNSKLNLGGPDLTRVAQAEADLDAVLAVYDKILATQKYLVGDEITLADLFHLPNGAALRAGKWRAIFEKYENVERWFSGLQGRESWVRAAEVAGTVG